MKKIYLDHSATTPIDPQVLEEMMPYLKESYGNPSSLHSFGREARAAVEESRAEIARIINARESEIYFVSCGTEADNLALRGIAYSHQTRGKHIITSAVEHKAVLKTCKALEKQGFDVTYLAVNEYGQLDPSQLQTALRPDTILISIIHGNNEVGTLNPIKHIGEIARKKSFFFHTDAVQSFGKCPIDVQELNLDLMSLSGHKIYGPKGIGAVYIRRGTGFEKMLSGGAQENNHRAGTENVAGIVGLAKAAKLCYQRLETDSQEIGALRNYLEIQLQQRYDTKINGHPHNRLYNILNVSFPGCDSETLLMSLDMKGIAVSTGSACDSGSIEPSHVLKALGMPDSLLKSGIRFSLGKYNTREEIDRVLNELQTIIPQLQKL